MTPGWTKCLLILTVSKTPLTYFLNLSIYSIIVLDRKLFLVSITANPSGLELETFLKTTVKPFFLPIMMTNLYFQRNSLYEAFQFERCYPPAVLPLLSVSSFPCVIPELRLSSELSKFNSLLAWTEFNQFQPVPKKAEISRLSMLSKAGNEVMNHSILLLGKV